jgi:cell division protein FtsA
MNHKYRPKNSIIAAIDIGSSKTVCLIARVIDDKGGVDIIGFGHVASKGVKAGLIINITDAEQSVKESVHAAEVMAAKIFNGYPLRDIVMSIPSLYTASYRSNVTIDIKGEEITQHHLNRAIISFESQMNEADHSLVHTIPTKYVVDGHDGVENPIGMHAQNLKLDLHCVKAETAALQNMITIAEKNHLDVDCLCVAPYAAGLASLVEDELNLGALVIDMGAGITSYAVFHKGAMIHAGAIPVGGSHVTNDLAAGLNTPLHHAERLKVLYGSCANSLSDSNETIDIPTLGDDNNLNDHQVPRATLVNIIRPRMEEIFELIRGDLDVNGMDAYAGGRVILTGGASQLNGVEDLAGMMLNKQVRIGKPKTVKGLPEVASGVEFAKTLGLITYACERMNEQPTIDDDNAQDPILDRAMKWLKENW